MNIFKLFTEWLKEYEPIGSWMYFNCTPVEENTTSLNTAPSSTTKEFIDGSKDVSINMSINLIKSYDEEGTSDTNIDAINEVGELENWITERDKNKDFPVLSDDGKIYITSIKVLSTLPSLAVDKTSHLAKYSFNIRLVYKDESEVI